MKKIEFTSGPLKGRVRIKENQFADMAIKAGIANEIRKEKPIDVKELKPKPQTKELKEKPKTK